MIIHRRQLMEKIRVQANSAGTETALKWVNEKITQLKLSKKDEMQEELMAEESIVSLMRHARENDIIEIGIGRRFNSTYLYFSASGSELNYGEIATELSSDEILSQTDDIKAQAYIQNLMAKAFADKIHYSRKNGINTVRLLVKKSKINSAKLSGLAIALAVVFGLIFRFFCPQTVNDVLCDSVFSSIQNVFMNMLFCTVGPIVFFSIISSVSSFTDLSSFGRIGVKVFATYCMTSIVAILIGVGIVTILQPGEFGSIVVTEVSADAQSVVSLKDTILGMVPDNIVKSFLENNTLQLIVLSVIIGISINVLGQHGKMIHDLFEAFNALFLQIIKFLSKLIPLVIFCSLSMFIIASDAQSILSILQILLLSLLGIVLMIGVYSLMLLISGVNPLYFLKKYLPTGMSVGVIQSSNAGIPINMSACDRLGVPKKIYSFSIPLGATINMDGDTICTSVMLLTFARLCGISLDLSTLITLCLTILLFSMATPGVPGATVGFFAIYFSMLGLDQSLFPLAITLSTVMDMFITFQNVTGDVAATVMVAKTEKLLDITKYKS